MNFFFDALKREAGEPVVTPEPQPQHAKTPVTQATIASAGAGAASAAAPGRELPQKRRAKLHGHFERMVATISPPVHDSSVVAMEQCRTLRNRVREAMRAKKARTLMLTSATAGEGKTLLSINLAYTLSQLENARVLLIDADLRRPSVAKTLGVDDPAGLTEYLREEIDFDCAVQQVSANLDLITATFTEHSTELVHSPQMERLLAQAAGEYDFVIVDGPPLFPIVDAQVLGGLVDAALLIVRAEYTPFELAAQCEHIEALRNKIIGAVLNCAPKLPHAKYGYGYGGYGSRYPNARG